MLCKIPDNNNIPGDYRSIVRGHYRCLSSRIRTIITNQTTITLKLVKSKTNRYYQSTKFKVALCKSKEPSRIPWFLIPFWAEKPDFVKSSLLNQVNRQLSTYNLLVGYVYDRCLETCSDKTIQIEIGRKHQPVSTNLLATDPFPINTLWIYAHVPEPLRNKLNAWINSSFEITAPPTAPDGKMQVHSEDGETTEVLCNDSSKPHGKRASRFDWESKWLLEREYANGPNVTDMHFTVKLFFRLETRWLHPNVFMPDYFTSIKPRPWTGEIVQVSSSSGDSTYCFVAALKSSSPVLEAQLRWEEFPLTLDESTEVFEPLIEFINNSHVTAATKSFKLTVELLFAANKYGMKELQEKLIDLIYVLPFSKFDDTEALVQLYLLLDVTRISDCVLNRVQGIVNLKANQILSNPIFQDLDPTHKSNISSLISTYDVVLDTVSLWNDNKHNTKVAEHYALNQAWLEENTRLQALHKRRPWQICCDYFNYCNFKSGSDPPAGEVPEKLIKIKKTYFPSNTFNYSTDLIWETR